MTRVSESVKKELLAYPLVTAVGHGDGRGERHENDEEAVVAFVEEKKAESELDEDDVLPKEVEGVKVDVQPVGEIGIEEITPQKPQDTGEINTTEEYRPNPQGVSIGHPDVTAGTAGFIAWRKKEKNGIEYPEPVGVTNNHVGANVNKANRGDKIIQPGSYDGGGDKIGELHDYIEIVEEDNLVDVSWYTIDGRDSNSYIPSVGVPTETAEVSRGDKVKKFGRTTGLKKGEVLSTDARINVRFGDGAREFTDQILTESISAGGDSGSAVVNEAGELVGLLFAGSSEVTVANKIENVLEETGLSLNPEGVYK
jgi:hypothetical protein